MCKEHHCIKHVNGENPIKNNIIILGNLREKSKEGLLDIIQKEVNNGFWITQKIVVTKDKEFIEKIIQLIDEISIYKGQEYYKIIKGCIGSEILDIAKKGFVFFFMWFSCNNVPVL